MQFEIGQHCGKEDPKFLTGQGRYVDDIGFLMWHTLRCTGLYMQTQINAIDTSRQRLPVLLLF